jgi:hypothetical protein
LTQNAYSNHFILIIKNNNIKKQRNTNKSIIKMVEEKYQRVLRPRQLSNEEIDRVCKRAYEDSIKAEYEAKEAMKIRLVR